MASNGDSEVVTPGTRQSGRLMALRVESDSLRESPKTRSRAQEAAIVGGTLSSPESNPGHGARRVAVRRMAKKRKRAAKDVAKARIARGSDSDDSDVFRRATKKPNKSVSRLLGRRGRSSQVQQLRLQPKKGPTPPKEVNMENDNIKPLWSIILPSIIREAATENGQLNQSWLAAAATVSKDFAFYAMEVLYASPEVNSDLKLQRLIDTITSGRRLALPSGQEFVYHRKVYALHFGPYYIPKDQLVPLLVARLPLIQTFTITLAQDMAPYGELALRVRRPYPDIFPALTSRHLDFPDPTPKSMQSFKWSWNIADAGAASRKINLDKMTELHTSGPLKDVRDLQLVGFFGTDKIPIEDADNTSPGYLAAHAKAMSAISKAACVVTSLQHLTSLTLEACSVVNGRFMDLLPRNLQRIEITYCWNLSTDDLSQFLLKSGWNLKSLTLCHNQGVGLGFLTHLASSTPFLEELHVNMNLFRSIVDGAKELGFEHALLPSETPAWPTTIRSIGLLYVRRFTETTAHILLHSLLDNSRHLNNLRVLVIKSYVDLGWRERNTMRLKWLSLLQKAFLRRPDPPPAEYYSLSQYRAPSPSTASSLASSTASSSPVSSPTTVLAPQTTRGLRRSGRVVARKQDSLPSTPGSSSSRSLQMAFAGRQDASSDDEGDGGGEEYVTNEFYDASAQGPLTSALKYYVQGKCTKVELTISDGTPTAVQFGMDDFMDEASAGEGSDDSSFEIY